MPHDISDWILIPEKLYGRDPSAKSFSKLSIGSLPPDIGARACTGLIPDLGKSSIVNELNKVIVPPRGIFISGKVDQHKRTSPTLPWLWPSRALSAKSLSKNHREVGYWRDAVREAATINGQLLVNLTPELELLTGKQPPVPELPLQDRQNRFQLVFVGSWACSPGRASLALLPR